jgi:choline dehydrogenase-like flavoprotein
MRNSSISGAAWSSISSPASSSVRPNTIVTRIHHDGTGASALEVISRDGTSADLNSRSIILAASPIETARLLLASGLDELCPRIGRGLTYHPIAGYALIEPGTAAEGPPGAALVPSDELPDALVGPDFSVEITGPFELATLDHELRERICPDAEPPLNSRVTFIHAMGELRPSQRRLVDLSPETHDSLGRAVPRIHLAWSESELEWINNMKRAAIAIADALAIEGGELVEYLDPVGAPMLFHEAGTCAMGTSIDSPCNPSGRLNVLHNVWVADASVFPSAGDRHPTLTILALAMRATTSAAEWLET